MQIDSINAKMLSELSVNARITDNALAKITRKSKDTMRYRIQKLKDAQIITAQSAIIDYTKLGLTSFKVYLTISASKDEYDALYQWAYSLAETFCIFEAQSGWHLGLAFFCEDVLHFERIQSRLNAQFGHIIREQILTHMTRAYTYADSFHPKKMRVSHELFGEIKRNTLSPTEITLLTELQRDASQTYVQLAQKSGISIEPTIRKIKQLQERNIIRRFVTNINYRKLGYSVYKVFISVQFLTTDLDVTLKAFLEQYAQMRNIISIIGPWRFEVEFVVKTHEELYTIVQEIQTQFGKQISGISYTIYHSEVYYPAGLYIPKMVYS